MFEVCETWVYWNKHPNWDPNVCLDMASYLLSQANLVFVYEMGIRIFVHNVVCDGYKTISPGDLRLKEEHWTPTELTWECPSLLYHNTPSTLTSWTANVGMSLLLASSFFPSSLSVPTSGGAEMKFKPLSIAVLTITVILRSCPAGWHSSSQSLFPVSGIIPSPLDLWAHEVGCFEAIIMI